jgi:hypothetical protein
VAIPKLTLDTNCIIAVEEARSQQASILSLRSLHDEGRIELRLVAASASERRMRGKPVRTFDEWSRYVTNLGFGGLDILKPIRVWGVGVWGQDVWGDGAAASQLYDDIAKAMFQTERPEGANKICDVLMMWAHIWYQGDCFVTTDADDFLSEAMRQKLIALGAGELLNPDEAEARFKAKVSRL